MSYENEVIKYLCKPENLKIALEISDKIDDVKNKIKLKFWNKVQNIISENIGNNNLTSWSTELPENIIEQWKLFRIFNKEKDYLYSYLSTENGRIYYGINTEAEKVKIYVPKDSVEINKLMDYFKNEKFNKLYYERDKIYVWKWLDCNFNKTSTLYSIASNDSIAIDVSNMLWELFMKKREEFEVINSAIENANKQ